MPISAADLSDGARNAVLAGMIKRASTRGFATPKLSFAHSHHPADLQLCAPHRIALLRLSTLRHLIRPNGAGAKDPATIEWPALSSVVSILGWRFLIHDMNQALEPIAAAHAVLTDHGDYRLAELNEGPYVTSSLNALQAPSVRQAIASSTDDGESCELLLLLAPAIYFAGLWIRYQDSQKDFILPMESYHLPPFVDVKPAQLLAVLLQASRAVPTDSALAG